MNVCRQCGSSNSPATRFCAKCGSLHNNSVQVASAGASQALQLRSLPFRDKAALCWSFCWRGIAISFASSVAGGLFGGAVAAIATALGLSSSALTATSIAAMLGAVAIGGVFFYVYLAWTLAKPLGKFRLALFPATY